MMGVAMQSYRKEIPCKGSNSFLFANFFCCFFYLFLLPFISKSLHIIKKLGVVACKTGVTHSTSHYPELNIQTIVIT